MKLNELMEQLRNVAERRGGELDVDVGLNHPEDGFTSKALELVDDGSFGDCVLLFGGDVEPAGDDQPTEEERLEQERVHYQRRADAFTSPGLSVLDFEERAACLAMAGLYQQRLRLLAIDRAQVARLTRVLLEREAISVEPDPA